MACLCVCITTICIPYVTVVEGSKEVMQLMQISPLARWIVSVSGWIKSHVAFLPQKDNRNCVAQFSDAGKQNDRFEGYHVIPKCMKVPLETRSKPEMGLFGTSVEWKGISKVRSSCASSLRNDTMKLHRQANLCVKNRTLPRETKKCPHSN